MIKDTLFNLNDIEGSGKKPKQHTPVEYPDTGSSTQVAKLLIMISEGEIEGFEAGDVYLRQVPATEYSVDVLSRRGLPDQEVIPGFAEVYAPLAATSASIKYGDGVGQHVIIAVPNTNDAVVLTQTLNALYKVESNGDTVGNTVSLSYYVSHNGVDWTSAGSKTISAKYSSGYAFSYTVARPTETVVGNVWYAKIVRTTEDSTSSKNQNATNFSQAIGVIYKSITYDRKALLGMTLKDAKQFGGSIPEILVRAKGIKVDVPKNYTVGTNGVGGTYATTGEGTVNGGWDGTFATARQFTCNPSWCLLHCLTDERVGLGIAYDNIDIFAFYDLAKYCDELVEISDVGVSINEIPEETASFVINGNEFTFNHADSTANINAIAFRIFGKIGAFVGNDGDELIAVNKQIGAATVVTVAIGSYDTFRATAIMQNMVGSSSSTRQEPRYTINAQFITREQLTTFFMYFLTLMNANWTSNEFGQLSVMWDNAEQQPSKQVTNATVIDGIFNYSSTDIEQRFNHVNVTFSDPAAFGRTNTVSVPEVDTNGIGKTAIDRAAIDTQSRYGFQQLDLVLVGCTSRAQAIRKARWALYNSCFLYDVIDFKVLFEGMVYQVGEIISVCDNFNQSELVAGMVLSHDVVGSDYEVVLDRELTLENDVEYVLTYLNYLDASQVTVTLTRTAPDNVFSSFLLPISGNVEPLNSSFIIHKASANPILYKVIKITKEDEIHSIVAIRHHDVAQGLGVSNTTTKYDYINNTVTIVKPAGDFSNITFEIVNPIPANSISITPRYSVDTVSSQLIRSLEVTWTAPTNPISIDGKIENRIFNYNIGISRPKTPGMLETHEVPSTSYTIENAEFGSYKIYVSVVDATNERSSVPKDFTYSFAAEGTSTLLPPIDLFIKDTTSTTFKESDIEITWSYDTANDAVVDTLYTYLLEIRHSLTDALLKEVYIPFDKTTKGGIAWIGLTTAQELAIPAYRSVTIKVYSIDALGRKSATAATGLFEKLDPPAPSFTFTNTGSQYKVVTDNSACQGYGVTHFNLYVSLTNGFTPSSSNLAGTKRFDPLLPMESSSIINISYPTGVTAGDTVYILVEASDSYIEVI